MSECFVYVIGRVDGPVKIGVSTNPNKRLSQLQVGCPFKIHLLCAFRRPSRADALKREKFVIEGLKEHHSHGEWHNLEALLVEEAIQDTIDFDEYDLEMESMRAWSEAHS